jgi:murein L,D-transpeptidase YcbB/YkuD
MRPGAAGNAGCAAALAILLGIVVPSTVADTTFVQPHHYELLQQALLRYRTLAAQPGLSGLPPLATRSLEPGAPYAGAAQLRRLLVALGDLPQPDAAQAGDVTLDPELVDGIRRFQTRHGLEVDGILGPATFRALTTPLTVRVRQIELTLERWNQLPAELDTPLIFINIPQFRLFGLYSLDDRESEMLAMDVVVGQTPGRFRTPVFAAEMTHVIFRPYWDVPRSIAVRELLPAIRADAGYLRKHDFEIVSPAGGVVQPTSANLDAVAGGALRLRQRPGPQNALGRVKFMLPNPYNVYLHDTPAQALFGHRRRTFSHGCVRVADAVALAEYVLRHDSTWTRDRILQTMNGFQTLRVDLPRPIRVFMVYGTAIPREDGQVWFLDDIYGHDALVAREPDRR